jgi:hypothetical protein
MTVLLFAVYCLKCPAASGPIQRFTFRPSSIFTIEVTEFHLKITPDIVTS